MVDAGTVLLSAGVATGVATTVTLLVEYAAKPSLEARKERILENARRRRALIDALRAADNAVHATAHEVLICHNHRAQGNAVTGLMASELAGSYAALRRAGDELEAARRRYPKPDDDLAHFAATIAGSLQGMGASEELTSSWDLVHNGAMLTILGDAVAWAEASRWQRRTPELKKKRHHLNLVLDTGKKLSARQGSVRNRI